MQKNIAAWKCPRAEDAIGFIGITDVKAQIEIALRIKPVQFIESLLVSKSSFCPRMPEVAQIE
jgi:hypothetical protein